MIRLGFLTLTLMANAQVSAMNLHESIARSVKFSSNMTMNFKVGDTANYNLAISSVTGTLSMLVTAVAPGAVTINQQVSLFGAGSQNVVEVVNPQNGNIIAITVNGQVQTPPPLGDSQMVGEIPTTVAVPAGTFKCLDTKSHSISSGVDSEQWIDSEGVIPAGGLIKMVTSQAGVPVVLELTSFAPGN